MYQITKAQLGGFRAMMVDNFVDRGVKHLREHAAAETANMTDEQLADFVRKSIPRAERYGLSSEQSVICVAHIRLLTKDRYETDQIWHWVPEMLGDETVEQSLRAKLALQFVEHVSQDPNAARAMAAPDLEDQD